MTMEAELEAAAGHLGAFDRLMLARKLYRWQRQLRVTARILAQEQRQGPPRLPRLTGAKKRKN